jgi:hypothetical protein
MKEEKVCPPKNRAKFLTSRLLDALCAMAETEKVREKRLEILEIGVAVSQQLRPVLD